MSRFRSVTVLLGPARLGRSPLPRRRASALAAAAFLGLALGCADDDPPLTNGVDAAEHDPWFPIGAGDMHELGKGTATGPIDCDSCHAGRDTFADAKCMGCHTEAALSSLHGQIAGYLAQDAACYACHPRGTRDAPAGEGDHSTTFFPIGANDAHGGAAYLARVGADQTSCSACHADTVDRSITLCAECHAADNPTPASAHSALTRSFDNTSGACMACHAETPINSTMHPLSNHTVIEPYHHGAECRQCHQTARAAPKEWAVDFSATSCTPCHPPSCSMSNPGACD